MFKIIAFFYNNAVRPVICEGWRLLVCGKNLHHRIISLKGEVCTNKTSSTPPRFIEVPAPCQEIEQPCICVLDVSILHVSMISFFLLHFENVSTVWYFLFFVLLFIASALRFLLGVYFCLVSITYILKDKQESIFNRKKITNKLTGTYYYIHVYVKRCNFLYMKSLKIPKEHI